MANIVAACLDETQPMRDSTQNSRFLNFIPEFKVSKLAVAASICSVSKPTKLKVSKKRGEISVGLS